MRPSRGTKIRKETILYAEPDKNAPPRWLKIRETADKLNVSETTVRRLLASGDLEGAKVFAGRFGWTVSTSTGTSRSGATPT